MKALEEVFAQTMPREMGFDYSGMSFQEKVAAEGVSPTVIFGFSFLVVFLILAAQYESWTLPFGVLLGTPIAVFGALAALWLRRFDNDVFAQIGLVMLIGLAARTPSSSSSSASWSTSAAAAHRRRAGRARLRLRPILMTAFAFILGVVPLVIARLRRPSRQILGTTVLGGMLAATLLAIFIIPVTFYVSQRFARTRAARPAEVTAGEATPPQGALP
jgi:HAE1 family hydrophobic/amphiphilic exporter-1